MRNLFLFMHTSLDGFVGGPNGEMNWINVDDEIFDLVGSRTNEADTALYGRVTYQMMEDYWPTAAEKPGATKHDMEHSAWYKKANKVVASKTMQQQGKVKVIGSNLAEEINNLKQQEGKDIIIFGSPTLAHSLMQLDLIDGYWLFVNPVLLGKGIPLFKDIAAITKLKLTASNVFSSGVVCLNYKRERSK